ncbi:MAG: thermonuclease family protein [Planctomycetota bacterium]
MARKRRRKGLFSSRRWRRSFTALGVTLVVALLGYDHYTYKAVVTGDWNRYHAHQARVVYIADGDTIDIDIPDGRKNVTRIRLWGVDTPEIAHGKEKDMHFGPEAKQFAEDTLENRRVTIELVPNKTRDKYGRLLAYVFLESDGTMYNELLLENGLAYSDLRFAHSRKARFEALEKSARGQQKGLWSDLTRALMPEWRQRMEKKTKRP